MGHDMEDDMDGFVTHDPERNGLPEPEDDPEDSPEDLAKSWEQWSDMLNPDYASVCRKRTMLEYVVEMAKQYAKHAISCSDPTCKIRPERPTMLCTPGKFLQMLTLEARRFGEAESKDFDDTDYGVKADILLSDWSSYEQIADDPRYIAFAGAYNIILVQAAVKRDSIFAPNFGGQHDDV